MNTPPGRQELPRLTMVEDSGEAGRRPAPAGASRPRPVVTYALLAVLAAVFAGMWVAGHGDVSSVATLFGDKENDLIRSGQVWRLVTAIFLHGSPMHLLVNGLSLYWLGAPMETFYGSRKFLLIFLFSGIAGNLLSFARSPAPSLGASGAIFGLVGAGLIFPIRYRSLVPERARTQILTQLLVVTAINLGIGFTDPSMHVDNMAHIGGLLGGGFAALFLMPDILRRQERSRLADRALWAAVALCLLVIGGSAFAQGRWAVRNAAQRLILYRPTEPNPWWSVGIPRNWRNAGRQQWVDPDGATVQIIDNVQNPQLIYAIASGFEHAGPPANGALIGGKPALHAQSRVRGRTSDLYLVLVDSHRAVVLNFVSPSVPSPATLRDFARILNSFRLVSNLTP